MRKLAIGLLALFRRVSLLARRLRGETPDDVAARRVGVRESWNEFCDSLKAAGAALSFPGAPRDPLSQAEGYRYLSRLARAGLMAFVEHADPRAPVLHRVVDETTKLGSDNPDNFYLTAALDGSCDYRITGRRGTIAYVSFGTQAGHYGQGGGLPPTGYVESDDIEMDEEGRFELVLSSSPRSGNWLPMTPETGAFVVRQTFLDRRSEVPAELTIERIDGRPEDRRPPPLTPEALDRGLANAGALVVGASLLFAKWARDFTRHSNELPLFDPRVAPAAGGDPNIAYYHSHWAVADDEALPRRGDAPRVRVLELPAEQLLDGIARLPPLQDPHQQAPRPLRGRRFRAARRGAQGSRPAQLDRDGRPRLRHHVLPLGSGRGAPRAPDPAGQAGASRGGDARVSAPAARYGR